MHFNVICKYSKECPVYLGNETIGETPLWVLKNVFCQRGKKGWEACEKYENFMKSEYKS